VTFGNDLNIFFNPVFFTFQRSRPQLGFDLDAVESALPDAAPLPFLPAACLDLIYVMTIQRWCVFSWEA
jgi:hypothetical protein